jgi:hypothetical protein
MKAPNFDKMRDIMSEWLGDDTYVQELVDDGMSKDDIIEKTAVDMIHGYMLLAGMKATKELLEVGADQTWIKSLLDGAVHNLEPDLKIELDESI